MDNNGGYIYILTNPSFPKYVKIGYAHNVQERLKTFNNSVCVPFAFRLYATYKVSKSLTDKKVHELIDGLNPNLRSVENINGKERKREFFAMTKEQAFGILKSIAEINDLEKNLTLYEPTNEEIEDEYEAAEIEKKAIDFDSFFINKNEMMIKLYKQLFQKFQLIHNDVYEELTPNYIAIRNERGKNICEVHLNTKSKIYLYTRIPKNPDLQIGEKVPDTYLWSLNYKIYFSTEEELDKVVMVLSDVYEQIKK